MSDSSQSRKPVQEYIVIHDSDSESNASIPARHSTKRQKSQGTQTAVTQLDSGTPQAEMNVNLNATHGLEPQTGNKNAHLKGRRRFKADLTDIEQECSSRVVVEHGFRIEKLQAGEDEGTIKVALCSLDQQRTFDFDLLISDTSDYPKNHVFFCSSDLNIPSDIVESVASYSSRTIRETVQNILRSLAKSQGRFGALHGPDSQEADMDDDDNCDDYDALDEFEEFLSGSTADAKKPNIQSFGNDFVETVAMGYRPGLLHFADDDFAISVSLPVVKLAQLIPPRALMAWDRRLLTRSQHLTLLISGFRGTYPPLDHEGAYNTQAQASGGALTFQVGLTTGYKPGKKYAKDAGRTFGLILADADDHLRDLAEKAAALDDFGFDYDGYTAEPPQIPAPVDEPEEGSFERFSLSSALESLLNQSLLKLIQLRRKYGLGWAGAELLFSIAERTQVMENIVHGQKREELLAADTEEDEFARTKELPHDPLRWLQRESQVNIILTAFCYLIRRLSLCPRYCIVCHNKLNNQFEALKPYVCDSKLCTYQYYSLDRGPSLEYEIIHNPKTVDLLVSIAYSAASEQVLDEPLPIGLGLRVPVPDSSKISSELPRNMHSMTGPPPSLSSNNSPPATGRDGMCDFDDLTLPMMRVAIVALIDTLPPIEDMKKYLERKVKAGKAKPRLKDMDSGVLPAAWSILRWCVASCTAHLEEITSGEESIQNLDPGWRQFRFSVGSPDAEAKFKGAVISAQQRNANAVAFHGSALRNWHSIIRHGLWFKEIVNGRAYGNGVYLAKEGNISMSTYAQPGRSMWRKSKIFPTNCVALAEVVNLPSEFVSHQPFFVIKDTHWIICRYLLVKCANESSYEGAIFPQSLPNKAFPFVRLDPSHHPTLNSKHIEIPEPTYQIAALLEARQAEFREEENDMEDAAVFTAMSNALHTIEVEEGDDIMNVDIDYYDPEDHGCSGSKVVTASNTTKASAQDVQVNDWKHDPAWIERTVGHMMSAPSEASPGATMAVQRELKATLKEQANANSLKELGWYMPLDLIGDNLFQWIVEMHSFDENLPIARDLKARNLNSVIFEIRFPPSYPNSPPFFRILKPRFLPFFHGGGGHVTGGGSICMDLLTADGWLPSYSIPAVLLQIKLAISNLDPRPARLATDYDRPYGAHEALEGYKRAATAHGWQVPVGIEKLVK